jgi:hypothetical protein
MLRFQYELSKKCCPPTEEKDGHTGIVVLAIGLAWLLTKRFGLGKLPGDIVIERDGFRLYIPVMTSIIVSVVLTLLFWLIGR